jgi:predicted ferric reductase
MARVNSSPPARPVPVPRAVPALSPEPAPGRAPARARPPEARRAPLTRPGRVLGMSRPGRESLVALIVALGAGAVIYMWWHDTSPALVKPGGPWITSAGRVTGLLGTYLVVVEVLLMGRVPWLDRMIGMDRLALWHRRNGEYSICLLVAHAALTIWGYAITAHEGLLPETNSVVLSYPDMLAATVGLGLLVLVGVLSARAVRRRVKYHTWYFIHLYTYIALALSFAHQFNTGIDFATHPLNRACWAAMYIAVAVALLYYRVAQPLARAGRRHWSVVGTVDEGNGFTSVYVSGPGIGELEVKAGQFFQWRFLTRNGWWQAHPFSLSAAPNGAWLRLTAKSLGDFSSTLRHLKPGTRVLLEGPYGAFTADRRHRRKVLLFGAGIGITPLRALLEQMGTGARPGELVVLYRAGDAASLALRGEIEELAVQSGAQIHYLVGARHLHPEYLTPEHLGSLVPDIAQRDIFLCGPALFTEAVSGAARQLGVPARQMHTESFEF